MVELVSRVYQSKVIVVVSDFAFGFLGYGPNEVPTSFGDEGKK
jgi:hypothetical protein